MCSQDLDCTLRAAGGQSVLRTGCLTLTHSASIGFSISLLNFICSFTALNSFIRLWHLTEWDLQTASIDPIKCVCLFVSLLLYLYTRLNILVLIHDWQDGLHAAVLHQVWLVPHKNQWHPAVKPFITEQQQSANQQKIRLKLIRSCVLIIALKSAVGCRYLKGRIFQPH